MSEEVRALTYIEIDVDFCGLVYGESPCEAVLGDTGAVKCFNTAATCQDRSNYAPAPLTLRYAVATDYLPADIRCIPNVERVSTAPTKLNPGKDLGQRESVTITFTDHRYHDIGLDKYVEERKTGAAAADGSTYDPFEQGTYWGKWRNRNRYYLGRPLRLIQGKVGQMLDEMETRHYVIESVEGPSSSGRFQITAKDVLKLADDDRAQAPNASPGTLRSDMGTGSISSIEVDNAETGDYPSSGRVRIGKEVFSYTGVSTSGSGIELTGVTRAVLDSALEDHDEEDTVQEVLSYEGERPSDIAHDLLTTYGNIPASNIDLSEWNDEDEAFIGRLYTGHIADPTGVRELLNELSQQCGFFVWQDVTVPELKFRAIRVPGTTVADVTDDDVVGAAPTPKEQPKKRRSQVWVFFARRSPAERLDEPSNFRSIAVTVDADAGSDDEYAQDKIEKIYSRWIGQFNKPAALDVGGRILARFRDAPRSFAFQMPYFSPRLNTGDIFRLITRTMQTDTGLPDTRRSIVLSQERGMGKVLIESEEFNYYEDDATEGERLVVIDSNTLDFNLRDAHDSIYTPPSDGDTVVCRVESGVIAGASDASIPAFDVGDWPSGVALQIKNNGRIQGAGGSAGDTFVDPNSFQVSADAGTDGGVALYTRYSVNLDNQGKVYGGGGGGGGAAILAQSEVQGCAVHASSAGGGGAGEILGAGGTASTANISSPDSCHRDGQDGTIDKGGCPGTYDEEPNCYEYPGIRCVSSGVGGNTACDVSATGGIGGDPGESATSSSVQNDTLDTSNLETATGSPGSPGAGIDGDSFVTYDSTGDIKGTTVN